jgi:hypothetical protein
MLDYDANSKWMIRHHGDSILRLAGARGIRSWKAVQAEPVHPRRLPDGMIEVRRRGQPQPVLYVLEVSAYPYARLARQAADDALLVYLVRGIVPEVVSLVLRPRGRKPAPRELIVRSEEGTTSIRVAWKVVELWKVPATELLAAGDIGLIPLVPLSRIDGPMEGILDEYRERIHRDAPAGELENLLSATHFFAGLKYNDPRLFQKLGGGKDMLKYGSPLLREIIEEETEKARREGDRDNIIAFLAARFGPEAEALREDLKTIGDARLKEFIGLAATCPDLASFREQIAPRKRKRRT